MKYTITILITLLLSFATALAQAEECDTNNKALPVIQEEVDEIIVFSTVGDQYKRIFFIKDNQVLATRLFIDDMIWTVHEDKFRLMWQDYSLADRVVDAKTFSTVVSPHDPTESSRCGPWWCMFRNMRDLKQP